LIFWSLQNRTNSESQTLDYMWLPTQKKSVQTYSSVSVYCMNFISRVTQKLFYKSFVPLVEQNPGDHCWAIGHATLVQSHQVE